MNKIPRPRLPEWLKKRFYDADIKHNVKASLRCKSLHTVCEEAKCPNLDECFSRGTATMLIMGRVCTRNCGFCAIRTGKPEPLDKDESNRVATQIRDMGLKHAVITSVTRDDLPDGGARHFADTILRIRKLSPSTTIEVLTPDFLGEEASIKIVCDTKPDVFNHNIETVKRLTPIVRNKAKYAMSLSVLKTARKLMGDSGHVKSGMMLGLGETFDEVITALMDLKSAGCNIITIGQYLMPSAKSLPVVEYVHPDLFRKYGEKAKAIGFDFVFSAPLVRSSYLADEVFAK